MPSSSATISKTMRWPSGDQSGFVWSPPGVSDVGEWPHMPSGPTRLTCCWSSWYKIHSSPNWAVSVSGLAVVLAFPAAADTLGKARGVGGDRRNLRTSTQP